MTAKQKSNHEGDFIHRAIQRVEGVGPIGISVAWAYLIALCLIILPPFLIIRDPWTVATNIRIWDELYVIFGALVDGGDFETSARSLTWLPFFLAIGCILISYRLRAQRQIMVGRHFGIAPDVPNQVSAFFFGRGMNILFPFGPGDQSTAAALVRNGADPAAATTTVFYYRVFEILGTLAFLGLGLAITGWQGAGLPILYCLIIFFGLSMVIRPLGRGPVGGSFLESLGLKKFAEALGALVDSPRVISKLFLMSILALTVEVLALLFLKSAFSNGVLGFLLLEEIPVAAYILAMAVANLARIIPFTPGGMGIYEMSIVTVLTIFGADNTEAAGAAMVDGFFTNLTLVAVFFFLSVRKGNCPPILVAWSGFFRQSVQRFRGEPISDKEVLAME